MRSVFLLIVDSCKITHFNVWWKLDPLAIIQKSTYKVNWKCDLVLSLPVICAMRHWKRSISESHQISSQSQVTGRFIAHQYDWLPPQKQNGRRRHTPTKHGFNYWKRRMQFHLHHYKLITEHNSPLCLLQYDFKPLSMTHF